MPAREHARSHPHRHQHVQRALVVAVLHQGRRAGVGEAERGDVAFDLGGDRSVVVIPQTAITFNPYGNAVFVIEEVKRGPEEKDPAGKPMTGSKLLVRQRFVKTGATRGDLIAVTEGLKPGERVVTSVLLKLRNDAEVTVNNKIQPAADAKPAPGNS